MFFISSLATFYCVIIFLVVEMKKYETDIINGVYIQEICERSSNYNRSVENKIEIFPDRVITNFYGMGGAITEASAYNYSLLNEQSKKSFLKDYYLKEGLNYNWGRVSIGSNDFSLSSYGYASKKDLSDFSLDRDKKYIIPLIQDILKIKKINLIASPWSPPKMYKAFPTLYLGTKLKKRYYDLYSKYIEKWLDEYQKLGIIINYITMQNEPFARQPWESCVFSLEEQKEFLYHFLLPKMGEAKVLLWDHNKDDLYRVYKTLYENNQKVGGIGYHYYSGPYFENIEKIRAENQDILLINTEACCGYSPYDKIRWINDAEIYLKDIIGDLNVGTNAYLDWNILLDDKGGPCHIKNPVKSPIVLKDTSYIKTPIYYYLYHISHFTSNGYQIIKNTVFTDKLKVASFVSPNDLVVVILNCNDEDFEYTLLVNEQKIYDSIHSHSIITYIFKIGVDILYKSLI